MRILLIVAMEKEANQIIKTLDLEFATDIYQLPAWLQTTVYKKKRNGHEIFLVTSGKDLLHQVDALGSGILPTAVLALDRLKPDLIINAGSAGGIGFKGMQIGDVVLCQDKVTFHDQLYEPDQVHMPYGIGSYPLPDVSSLVNVLQVKTTRVSTGSSLLAGEADTKQFERNDATLKDMEAGHIARLCTQAGQKFLIIKVVSDLIDADICPQEQFTKNIGDVMQILAIKVQELIVILTTAPGLDEACVEIPGRLFQTLVMP